MRAPPGLGASDAGAPTVVQPDTNTTATPILPANQDLISGPVSALEVRPNVFMLTVGNANFALTTGPQGTVVIDSGGSDCNAVVATVKRVVQGPIRYVLQTSADQDRVGCTDALSAAGRQFGYFDEGGLHTTGNAPVYAQQNVLLRLSQQSRKNLPSETFTRQSISFSVGGQGIQGISMPAAHTDGDIVVLLRQADVIVAGNLFDDTHFPVIDVAHGGSIQGEIRALNRLLEELTIPPTPKWIGWYGTMIIPGRGHLCDQGDVLFYRDMLTIIRDRVASLIAKGRSLVQVQAADPARGYEARFGATEGSWTTRDFIEAVYKSLQAERSSRKS